MRKPEDEADDALALALNNSSTSPSQRQGAISEDSLLFMKRSIIEGINSLVNQFNEITKLLRDSTGKSLKTESTLNELISKNKDIQGECDSINERIEGAKRTANDISARLNAIINAEILEDLSQKFTVKES